MKCIKVQNCFESVTFKLDQFVSGNIIVKRIHYVYVSTYVIIFSGSCWNGLGIDFAEMTTAYIYCICTRCQDEPSVKL
jgi:hypothetical protein